MKYTLAILACAAEFVLWHFLGAAVLEWEHGGGLIPQLILSAVIIMTWLAITRKRQTEGGDQ